MTYRPPSSDLPPSLKDALASEPADEQEALAHTWALLDHAREAEPTDADFADMGSSIWTTLVRELTPAGPPDLPDEVRDTLQSEPEQERHALTRTWTLAGKARQAEPSDAFFAALAARIWPVLDAETAQPARSDRTPVRRGRPVSRRLWAPLLAGILLLVVVGQWYTSQPARSTAPLGDTLTLSLEDGSTVILNSGSTLRYPESFGETRAVTLDGEAYFEVAHDAERPFIVNTFNASVEVLGTAFNVRAHPDDVDAQTEVALYEGAVRVASDATADHLNLQPGQHVSLGPNGLSGVGELAPAADRPDWRLGRFTLTNRPLSTVVAEAERRFNVTIDLPADLHHELLTLTHTAPDVETLLRDIVVTKGLVLDTTTSGYRLRRP